MAATSAMYNRAFFLARGLDQLGSWLQTPSHNLLGTSNEGPILTTKYIFASFYSTHNAYSIPLAKRVQKIEWQKSISVLMRVVWAVSVVLPVFDFLGAISKELAAFEPNMYAHYKQEEHSVRAQQSAKEVLALGNAVKEFTVILATLGCKKEEEEGAEASALVQLKREKFAKFLSHFKNQNKLNEAIDRTADLVLQLIEQICTLRPNESELKENDDNDHDLYANIAHCFLRAKQICYVGNSTEVLLGEVTSCFAKEWNYLLSRKDRLYRLCEGRAQTFEEATLPKGV